MVKLTRYQNVSLFLGQNEARDPVLCSDSGKGGKCLSEEEEKEEKGRAIVMTPSQWKLHTFHLADNSSFNRWTHPITQAS